MAFLRVFYLICIFLNDTKLYADLKKNDINMMLEYEISYISNNHTSGHIARL